MPAEIIATSNSKPASCPIGAGSRGSRVGGGLAATSRQDAAKGAGVQGGGAECYLTETERQSGFRIEPYAAARIDSDSQPHKAAAAMTAGRSEEHTSELQSLMRISSAVFCLTQKKYNKQIQ